METTTLKTVLDFGYKALAQGWWTALGFVVGFAGVFLGAFGANYFGYNGGGGGGVGTALSFVPIITAPACMLISGAVTATCITKDIPTNERILICGGINFAMFSILFLWAFKSMKDGTKKKGRVKL